MSFRKLRSWAALAAAPCVALAIALPAASVGASATHVVTKGSVTSLPKARGGSETMIVLLKDQNRSVPALTARRSRLVTAEQRPLLDELHRAGVRNVESETLLNALVVNVAPNQVAALKANPAVQSVYPNSTVPGASPTTASTAGPPASSSVGGRDLSNSCPTANSATNPETDPEALSNINALGVVDGTDGGIDGAGVTVAYMAEGIDTTNPDFQRNAAFASAGSPAGSPVIDEVDFSGDGTAAATSGGEAFLDASSIAAQGNVTYNLNTDYLSSASQTPTPCYIKIYGAAPGADVMGLKVFSNVNYSTTSGFLQAIQYAVANGVKVLNESFGSNDFPDTSQDVIRAADEAAVAAGVTVVVSSGDAGNTSTIGSPSTDPAVISVGATTTFRSYAQSNEGGFDTPGVGDGKYIDNNISDLSSGGYSDGGKTVDLVAPGDLNWDVCTDSAAFSDCVNEADTGGADMGLEGGTSEAAPLTSAAAADVIQAYSETHDGNDPSPALVKQIIMSTATDIGAPAQEQGAGLLNVGAAIQEAESMPGSSAPGKGGLLISPNQIDVSQNPGGRTPEAVTVTNTGESAETVHLSTRELSASPVAKPVSGTFCMQPGTPSSSCPANTGVMPIWSGVDEVYQTEAFSVPKTTGTSRLQFTADYQYTGQGSLLHIALFDPSGAYAGYSLPQGLADYAEVEVTDPAPGTWHAVFFTEQDGATGPTSAGTSGPVQWSAATYEFKAGDAVRPATLTIPAGKTARASLFVTSPASAGDSSESIVLSGPSQTTTIPVAVRTMVPISHGLGTFSGVLGGGNGRAGAQAQSNTYTFDVPAGETSLSAGLQLQDLNVGGIGVFDVVIANLVDPNGQVVSTDTNSFIDNEGNFDISPDVWGDVANPLPGQWQLVLEFENPVAGTELSNPFAGVVVFNDTSTATSSIPDSPSTTLDQGYTYTYQVNVTNNGANPSWFFADPRTNGTQTFPLADQNGSESDMTVPGTSEPIYYVPTETSSVEASLTGTGPVSFDAGYCYGDPDLSPAVPVAGSSGSQSGFSASLTYSEPEVSQGCWYMDPAAVGPFGPSGAASISATANLSVTTQAFDTSVVTSTGDMWSIYNGLSTATFNPLYLTPGQSGTITVEMTATGSLGSVNSGTLYIDDAASSPENAPAPSYGLFGYTLGDVVASIPYSYTVGNTGALPSTAASSTAGGRSVSGSLPATSRGGALGLLGEARRARIG